MGPLQYTNQGTMHCLLRVRYWLVWNGNDRCYFKACSTTKYYQKETFKKPLFLSCKTFKPLKVFLGLCWEACFCPTNCAHAGRLLQAWQFSLARNTVFVQLLSFTEFGSLTTSQLMEKVRGLQNLAYQLGLEEGEVFD